MSAPSRVFYADLSLPLEEQYAYIINPLFPDQRVDADSELIQDARGIMGFDAYKILQDTLLQMWQEKYSQD